MLKNKIFAGSFTLVFVLTALMAAAPAQAAQLNQTQIQAILNLLSAFGVNSTTIATVNVILQGGSSATVASSSVTSSSAQNVHPSCTIATDKSKYTAGDSITLSWTSSGANSAFWEQPDPKGKDNVNPPSGIPAVSGSAAIVATVAGMPYVTLNVFGPNATTGSCTKTIEVDDAPIPDATLPVGASATIDNSSLVTNQSTHYVTGTVNDSNGIAVSISTSAGVTNTAFVHYGGNGTWYVITSYDPGAYTITVRDAKTSTSLATGQLIVSMSTANTSSSTVTIDANSLAQILVLPSVAPGYAPVQYGSFMLVGSATNLSSIYIAVGGAAITTPVSGGRWGATLGGFAAGTYQVNVYDSASKNLLLASGTLVLSRP